MEKNTKRKRRFPWQGFGHASDYGRELREQFPYDPDRQYAVIRSSICTGEKVAGFKNREDGHFTEVMVIRTKEEEQRFREIYGIESIRIEY